MPMKTVEFEDLKFKTHPNAGFGFNTQAIISFKNGYGASVITGASAYTSVSKPYELSVLDKYGKITYATPITNDVIGHLNEIDVQKILNAIAAL